MTTTRLARLKELFKEDPYYVATGDDAADALRYIDERVKHLTVMQVSNKHGITPDALQSEINMLGEVRGQIEEEIKGNKVNDDTVEQ